MTRIQDIVDTMRQSQANVHFADLAKVCDYYFGQARKSDTHYIYKTPWRGNPRVNIQEGRDGKAKVYQVRQILAAIEKLEQE